MSSYLLGRCPDSDCEKNGTDARPLPQARSLEPKADALLQPSEDGALMASYSVFVLEPGEQVGQYKKNGMPMYSIYLDYFFVHPLDTA